GIVWGLFNGFLIAKGKIPPLIVTLGTLGITLGLAQILTGGVDIREVPLVLTTSIGYGNVFGTIPMLSVIALVVVVIGAIALRYTRFGLYTLAVGSSEIAARRVGVKVDRHLIAVYTLSG
ncbi:ABC transporter permease, partial [Microbacteriaceae bacterium K1510]|nr:ABC transporter permease [Microbacteriaceae bacterium K1510]